MICRYTMNKHRNFAKQTAAEWKARGFKSSTAKDEPEATDDNAFSKAEASIKKPKSQMKRKMGAEERIDDPPNKKIDKLKTESFAEKPKKKFVKTDVSSTGPSKKAKPGDVSSPAEKPKKKVKKQTTEESETPADGTSELPSKKKKPQAKKSEETANPEGTKPEKKPVSKRKKQKFRSYSLFIGNLSYQTTKEQITEHFKVTKN